MIYDVHNNQQREGSFENPKPVIGHKLCKTRKQCVNL